MLTLIVPATVPACQIEGFPEAAERSIKGALHIKPASTMEVTADEWKHIRESRKDVAAMLIEVPQAAPVKPAESKPEADPPPAPAPRRPRG